MLGWRIDQQIIRKLNRINLKNQTENLINYFPESSFFKTI